MWKCFLDSCACEPGQLVYTGVFYWRFLRGKKQCTGKVIRRFSGMSRISWRVNWRVEYTKMLSGM